MSKRGRKVLALTIATAFALMLLSTILKAEGPTESSISPVEKVSHEYMQAHLNAAPGQVKVLQESYKCHRQDKQVGMYSYKAIVETQSHQVGEFNLTVVHSNGKWTALELESTISYESQN